MIHSILEDIPGIGDKTIGKLLTTFGSVNKIAELSVEELSKVVNLDRATKIYKHFHPDGENPSESSETAVSVNDAANI